MPSAAPTRKRPCSSLQDRGYFFFFWISLKVMRPCNSPLVSVTGSFSILNRCNNSSASSSVVPNGAVTRFSVVIISAIRCLPFVRNLISRFVTIPISRRDSSTTGKPEILYFDIICKASWTVSLLVSVIGLRIIPLSDRLTISTSSAWRSALIFL